MTPRRRAGYENQSYSRQVGCCVIMEQKNNTLCAFKQLLCSHTWRKKGIFDLSRFYASNSSYSTQKQTRIMASFASHTEAQTRVHTLFSGHDALTLSRPRVQCVQRGTVLWLAKVANLAILLRVNKLWFYFKVPRDAYLFLLFMHVLFLFFLWSMH